MGNSHGQSSLAQELIKQAFVQMPVSKIEPKNKIQLSVFDLVLQSS